MKPPPQFYYKKKNHITNSKVSLDYPFFSNHSTDKFFFLKKIETHIRIAQINKIWTEKIDFFFEKKVTNQPVLQLVKEAQFQTPQVKLINFTKPYKYYKLTLKKLQWIWQIKE